MNNQYTKEQPVARPIICYCADTRYAEKVAEKNEQHEKLVDMLKMYGYDVQLRPMPLVYAGTIYNCNLSMLQDLGLQRTVAKGVLKNCIRTQSCAYTTSSRRGDT